MIAYRSGRRSKYFDTLYCTDPECRLRNEPQDFQFLPASWDGPSEWVDDPECRACYGDVHEYPLDDEEGEE